jgi:glycosyltransferase involved in cell wall biosynthesis
LTEEIVARHYVPGGRSRGGGIGRLVGYVVDAAADAGQRHAITDTRGEAWSVPRSLVPLVGSVLVMTSERLTAPRRIHHIHMAGRGSTLRKLILTAAARTLGCIHVLHLHDYDYGNDYLGRPPWQRALVRRMFRGADRVVVLGRRDRALATDVLGVDPERVLVLHNCVPDPGPHPKADRREPVIVFLGRLSERKGVPELLAALADPAMETLRWRAVLAGDGPVDAYRAAAATLGLADRVTMPGWMEEEETRALCRQADILVLPSHQEGMAMAVLEGLAHSLAVVTTPVGAHDEAIDDGESGVFVRPGDADALAEILSSLVSHPERRAALAAGARARFEQRFSMARYLPALCHLYAGLAARPALATPVEQRPT